ncbi:MAG TPA: hypothetical protein VIR33_15070 [Thermopolyspora sp.]
MSSDRALPAEQCRRPATDPDPDLQALAAEAADRYGLGPTQAVRLARMILTLRRQLVP